MNLYKLVLNNKIIPFGQPIGIDSNNIIAYSSDEKTNSHKKKYSYLKIKTLDHIIKKIFCGIKFQCVEYARRWLILVKNITFEQIDMAYMLFTSEIICFRNIWTKQYIPYTKCPNGSSISPKSGSILLWDQAENYLTGHVAIILNIDEDYIYIGEQNWKDIKWSNNYSRKISIKKISNQIWLDDSDTNSFNLKILGWINLINI
jgi:glutathionylspermidine amidase/synthetase